jgi:hypothetical protein
MYDHILNKEVDKPNRITDSKVIDSIKRGLGNREKVFQIAEYLQCVLDREFCASHNVKVKVSPRPKGYAMPFSKISISIIDDELNGDGKVRSVTEEEMKWRQDCRRFPNIKPTWYRRLFRVDGEDYEAYAINPKAHTYPIICRRTKYFVSGNHKTTDVKVSESFFLNGILNA